MSNGTYFCQGVNNRTNVVRLTVLVQVSLILLVCWGEFESLFVSSRYKAVTEYMPYTIPSWIIAALGDVVVPDNYTLTTSASVADLESAVDLQPLSTNAPTQNYPGLVPDLSVQVQTTPAQNGLNYQVEGRKAVGFWGICLDVFDFDEERINQWNFPLLRRNFGYVTLSRNSRVVAESPVHYGSQLVASPIVLQQAYGYKPSVVQNELTNQIDKVVLNQVDSHWSPTVRFRVSFLPIWEVWALNFFQA